MASNLLNISILQQVYSYLSIFGKYEKQEDSQILEPLTTIVRLAIISFKSVGTKIAITNNKIYVQSPNLAQGVIRWTYGNNREEIHYDLLRRLEGNPQCTQRELSKEMGVSLGKVNYCIRKLIEKGWVKLVNFSNNPDKAGYTYLLTPTGIEEKGRLTISFLKIKLKEYQMLKIEIEKLKKT